MLWVDYMKETRSLLAHIDVPKTSESLKIFFFIIQRKKTRSINELKADEIQPFLISFNSRG